MAADGSADDAISDEVLDRIAAGLEHPPKPDFVSDEEWAGIVDSRDPAIIRMAGGLQVDMYRQGVEGADMAQGGPVLILTTTGRKTGNEITTCVNYAQHDEELFVVGSFAAFGKSPFWVLNLDADPRCTVEIHGESWPAVARRVAGEERERLWPRLTGQFPLWGHFQKYCRREFPVFALPNEPTG